ncbi:MAG: hypothetical protein BWX80_03527 [Candidatus Hydrogenedentes bacterium ADurb.Bin101]|nr:MAG: hypothetical protein BWX80_03527 [Candidatus Hydrogenedentes bacterium ADurb.Bin101]
MELMANVIVDVPIRTDVALRAFLFVTPTTASCVPAGTDTVKEKEESSASSNPEPEPSTVTSATAAIDKVISATRKKWKRVKVFIATP